MEVLITISYIVICVLLFSLAIAIHEFGHFIVALKCGLPVERFSIGFGPAIWKKTWRGVEYRISWIPLGGYVSIPDIDPEGTKALEDAGENKSKEKKSRRKISPLKEIAVAVAGPAMNIVLALIIALILAFVPSSRFGEGLTVVDEIDEFGPSANLQRGDIIRAVDGVEVKTWFEVLTEVQLAGNRTITLDITRDGKATSLSITPVKRGEIWSIGAESAKLPIIGAIEPDSPASHAGLMPGDLITKINEKQISFWSDVISAINENGAKECVITIDRNGEKIDFSILPKAHYILQKEVEGLDAPAIISSVVPSSPAEKIALISGDRVLRFGEEIVTGWGMMQKAIQRSNGKETKIVIERKIGDELKEFEFLITPEKMNKGRYYIGALLENKIPAKIYATSFKAQVLGFIAGQTILSLNGESVSTWADVIKVVNKQDTKKPLAVELSREISNGEHERTTLYIQPTTRCADSLVSIGVAPVMHASWMAKQNPLEQIKDDAKGIFRILKALVTPKSASATSQALGGPVMIAMSIYSSVRHDFCSGLGFLRYLNVNLAILNLLPIPVLDGGLILFSFIAFVFRRRIPEKIVSSLTMIFMYALLALMAILIYRDSIRGVKIFSRDSSAAEYEIVETLPENCVVD